MLIAKVIAHVLEVRRFGEWNGVGWCDEGKHKVCHRSLPFNILPVFPDVDRWIAEKLSIL